MGRNVRKDGNNDCDGYTTELTYTPEHPVPWATDASSHHPESHPEIFSIIDSDSDVDDNIDDFMDFPTDMGITSPHRNPERPVPAILHENHYTLDGCLDNIESENSNISQDIKN